MSDLVRARRDRFRLDWMLAMGDRMTVKQLDADRWVVIETDTQIIAGQGVTGRAAIDDAARTWGPNSPRTILVKRTTEREPKPD